MLATVTERDFLTAAVVIVIVAFLIYRILRGEPNSRIIRLGVFIERRWRNGNGRKPDTHQVDPEDKETKIDWPQRDEEI